MSRPCDTEAPDNLFQALTVTPRLCFIERPVCPFCGTVGYTEVQEHGHYRTECCKQITTGCCDGTG